MKRVFWILFCIAITAAISIIAIQVLHDPGSDRAGAPVADAAEQIKRGAYLVRAGDCMACHTIRGGAPNAGGRAIETPFGRFYSSNITPDAETGIGAWNADDFWRAIHNGKSKDGKFLYPAFPYPNFTKVTRTDSDAMFAYLKTVAPVKQTNKSHELSFPYNYRVLLAFWRTLYFMPGEYQVQANQSAEWNRGAYLVQGLGHCNACHTSRNALGGTIAEADLAGGMIPILNWYASSLTSNRETGLGSWEIKDITDLLQTGVSHRGAVFGPMAEVVGKSLQHLSDNDIGAMATYLKAVPEYESNNEERSSAPDAEVKNILAQGAKIYEKHCASCHQTDGTGVPPAYPPLAGNRSLAARSAINSIRIVLNGGYPPTTKGNPRPYGMPPFGTTLSDKEVAAVVSYIRMTWGNHGGLIYPIEVNRFRSVPIE